MFRGDVRTMIMRGALLWDDVSVSNQLMEMQEAHAYVFRTRWHGCTLAHRLGCRRVCGHVDVVDSQAQLIDDCTYEQALCSSRTQTVVRAARNGVLNFGPRASQAAKKPDPHQGVLRGVLTHPAQPAATSVSRKSSLTSYRITRDVFPSRLRIVRFSAIQSCMRGSTKHCVRRLTL